MDTIEQRLDQVEIIIKKPSFRQNKGLGNEVGYYIFDYPAEKELLVRERIDYIQKKYEHSPDGFRVIVFDLYDIIIDQLSAKGYIDKTIEMEKKKGFERVVRAVGNTMRIATEENLIVSYIQEHTPDNSVVFLVGVGKCYPLLRSHTVLNCLHEVVNRVPIVMFFPGYYDGQELILFGEIKDDNYYRAFKLVD